MGVGLKEPEHVAHVAHTLDSLRGVSSTHHTHHRGMHTQSRELKLLRYSCCDVGREGVYGA